MSRLTGNDAKEMLEAYSAVYAPQELTEEQVWEEVENWVNSLLEEGYDLSEYTWEEMYEMALGEIVAEQQSDTSKQWERGARWFGRATDRYFANPVSSAVKKAADYAGQATSGIVKAATGVDLEKVGRNAERFLGAPGEKPQPKSATIAKPTPKPTQTPASSSDVGRGAGEYLAPSRGSSRAADPLVRAGGSYGFGGPIKPQQKTPEAIAKLKPSDSGVKRGPKGGVIVNHVELENDSLVLEAPAQVAPITGKAGKEWFQKSKSGQWVPITDMNSARQASERWKSERQKIATAPAAAPAPAAPRALPVIPSASTSRPAPAPRPKAPAPAPVEKRISTVTGKSTYVGTTSGGEKFERRAATRAELDAARKAREEAKKAGKNPAEVEKAAVSAGISAPKTQKESFDLVLEYLLSEGHTDTLEEALYVMMEMDPETIQSICEGYQELNYKRRNRMTDQAMRHMSKGDDKSWEKAYSIENQRDTQTPEVSKAKAAANRAKGAAKRGKG